MLGPTSDRFQYLHGAHSVDGKDPLSDDKEPHVQIARKLALFKLGYMDLIVLETALYLHAPLLKAQLVNVGTAWPSPP